MRIQISIFSLFAILIFASCEDKQSSRKNTSETPSKSTADAEKRRLDSIKTAYLKDANDTASEENPLDSILPIPQEKLMPFLREYGRQNPETRVLITTEFGEMEVSLYRDTPLHRANFILLVKEGYFDDTYFHRVAPGFVIQGGNADNRATNYNRNRIGSYLIPSEFKAGHKHHYGAFSAAKYSEQNVSKASSPFEFFIVMDKQGTPHLDNDHTVFGRVTRGMEVAEKIAEVETGNSEWPVDNLEMKIEILD